MELVILAKKESKLKRFLEKVNKKISLQILSWILLIMSLLALVSYTWMFYKIKFIHFGIINSLLGVVGFFFIRRKNKIGLTLALVWSALQIISIQYNAFTLSLIQFFDLSIRFSLISEPYVLIKIDFLAILLFYLFYKKRSKMRLPEENGSH